MKIFTKDIESFRDIRILIDGLNDINFRMKDTWKLYEYFHILYWEIDLKKKSF